MWFNTLIVGKGMTKLQLNPRPHTGSDLSVQVHAPSENFLLVSYATGLSPDGLFVRASRTLPLGTRVRLALNANHSGDESVVTYGKVIRVHDGPGTRGMEMAFESANGSKSPELNRLLNRFRG